MAIDYIIAKLFKLLVINFDQLYVNPAENPILMPVDKRTSPNVSLKFLSGINSTQRYRKGDGKNYHHQLLLKFRLDQHNIAHESVFGRVSYCDGLSAPSKHYYRANK